MMDILSDMIEKIIKIFMDDFSVFGDSYEGCLENLRRVLERCEEKNLVLNWEKCHYMVTQGIVLGHVVSKQGIEVDKAKVELISNLPTPKCVKDILSFLGHVGFYRRFIKISVPYIVRCVVCLPRMSFLNGHKHVTRLLKI